MTVPVKGRNKGAVTQEICSSPACLCSDDDDTKLTKSQVKISKTLTDCHPLLLQYLETEPKTSIPWDWRSGKVLWTTKQITPISIFLFQSKFFDWNMKITIVAPFGNSWWRCLFLHQFALIACDLQTALAGSNHTPTWQISRHPTNWSDVVITSPTSAGVRQSKY